VWLLIGRPTVGYGQIRVPAMLPHGARIACEVSGPAAESFGSEKHPQRLQIVVGRLRDRAHCYLVPILGCHGLRNEKPRLPPREKAGSSQKSRPKDKNCQLSSEFDDGGPATARLCVLTGLNSVTDENFAAKRRASGSWLGTKRRHASHKKAQRVAPWLRRQQDSVGRYIAWQVAALRPNACETVAQKQHRRQGRIPPLRFCKSDLIVQT
jgi:hypothetical protein